MWSISYRFGAMHVSTDGRTDGHHCRSNRGNAVYSMALFSMLFLLCWSHLMITWSSCLYIQCHFRTSRSLAIMVCNAATGRRSTKTRSRDTAGHEEEPPFAEISRDDRFQALLNCVPMSALDGPQPTGHVTSSSAITTYHLDRDCADLPSMPTFNH